jgi:hypothetical protein
MTDAILRISITDDGGKWAPGTILGAYPVDEPFGAGDMASFRLVRVTTSKSLAELKAMRRLKVLDLKEILTSGELSELVAQKEQVHFEYKNAQLVVTVGELSKVPDLNKSAEKDFATLTVKDCDPKYYPRMT